MMRILIAGDYCPQERVSKLISKGQGETVMENVKPYIQKADYSIVNFECSVADKTDNPIAKYGPCLSCTADGVALLKTIGFDCAALANNHFRDYGDVGVRNTLRALRENKLDYVGGGANIEEADRILYKRINNTTLAIVNICENEFSIATTQRGGSAPMNPVTDYYKLTEAKEKADFTIVFVHGGHEGYQYPSPRMMQLYRWYVDIGANFVVNCHQHCYSGYEYYHNTPIVYGLGNFCFDEEGSRDGIWNIGYFLNITIEERHVSFDCIPYEQCNKEPVVRLLVGKEKGDFERRLSEINDVINDKEAFDLQTDHFLKERKGYISCITPYSNEYLRVASSRGWLPMLLPQKKLLNILNFIQCESHRDLLIGSINNHINYE